MEMLEALKPKHIAVKGQIGNTKYAISDDYCVPPEEVPEILQRIARDAQRAFAAQAAKDKLKANEVEAS